MTMNEIIGNEWLVVLVFIVIDVSTGLLASAKERKIDSSISYVGLIKKMSLFLVLAFVTFIDALFTANGTILKTGLTLIIATEGISIIENFSRIGINLSFLTQYFMKK